MPGYEFFCICRSPSGERCPYRSTNKESQMCGVHALFKDSISDLSKCFPCTFNNHK